MGESIFKLGRYYRVFLEIWAQIPIWAPMLKQWAVGSFFSRKYSRRADRDPQKFSFFHKNKESERNGDHDDLEWPMLSYYVIYCDKFRKILQRTEKVALNECGIHSFPIPKCELNSHICHMKNIIEQNMYTHLRRK